MSDGPIIKIGEIDLEKLKKDLEIHYFPRFENTCPRQFPLQGSFEGDWDGAQGNTLTLRNDEVDYTVKLYEGFDYTYSIINDYNLYRTRIMNMPRATAYGWHLDLTPRIHIPITTDPACMFILDDVVYRIPADGGVYWVDTTLWHTAVNASRAEFNRIHLMGNTNLTKSDARSLADRL